MKEMQLIAVVLSLLMALALITLLPPKVKRDRATNHSRWLMAAGLLLLGLQFLLQYLFGFRQIGIEQAVMLNLAMLIPVSALLALSILNLQRQGQLNMVQRWIGVPTWMVAMSLVGFTSLNDGKALGQGSQALIWAEVAASSVFCLMQICYARSIVSELKRMKHVLDDYFDHAQDGLLRWMQISIIAMTVTALTAPFCIFLPPQWLLLFVSFVMGSICYTWFCFVRYVLTSAASRMREAEGTDDHGKAAPAEENTQRIGTQVEKWVAKGCHLRHDVRRDDAAREMGVPSRQLSNWVKAAGYDSYSQWITTLRIDEAKRLIVEHRDWSIDAIADHCGISRQNFYKVFQEHTGTTPAKFHGE